MNKTLTGIVIASRDYKEKDKIITLLTVEQGLIKIIVRGVKNPNAKLKFAKELFTFGYFDVAVKGSFFYLLTGCEVIEMFDNVKTDPEKYIEICNLTNIVKDVAQYNDLQVSLFLEYVSAVKSLNYENIQHNLILAKFLVKMFEGLGYKLNLTNCCNCGAELQEKRFLNIDSGEIVCDKCKSTQSIELSNLQFANLRIIVDNDYNSLSNIKLKQLDDLLNILVKNYQYKVSQYFKFYL